MRIEKDVEENRGERGVGEEGGKGGEGQDDKTSS